MTALTYWPLEGWLGSWAGQFIASPTHSLAIVVVHPVLNRDFERAAPPLTFPDHRNGLASGG